jgi:two-component system, sensor histidine kinase RegB
MGEMPESFSLQDLKTELFRLLLPRQQSRLSVQYQDPASAETRLFGPRRTLAQVLNNLVQNAFDAQGASANTEPVELVVVVADTVSFRILDRGPGLDGRVATAIGRPFVTTKSENGGLGLGVYLARSFAQRMGGALSFEPRSQGGLQVTLRLPQRLMGGRL